MSDFAAFVLACGGLLAFAVLVLAWLFRTAAAPLWAKILAPAVAASVACWLPFAVNSMMGFPVSAQSSDLPPDAELVAFVPHDESAQVDLWLRAGEMPRAYETALTGQMKRALREAQAAMARGETVRLMRKGRGGARKSRGGDALGLGDDDSRWELLIGNSLPAKE